MRPEGGSSGQGTDLSLFLLCKLTGGPDQILMQITNSNSSTSDPREGRSFISVQRDRWITEAIVREVWALNELIRLKDATIHEELEISKEFLNIRWRGQLQWWWHSSENLLQIQIGSVSSVTKSQSKLTLPSVASNGLSWDQEFIENPTLRHG